MDVIYNAIDVSKHQGKINWEAVKNAGVTHAMLRAGYGRYKNQVDPQFERNSAECERLGIQYGGRKHAAAWPQSRASICACRWPMTLSMSRASCA